MVHERDDMEGIDSSIILNRLVWKYSGHEDTFSDPLVDCKECKSRFRADKLVEEYITPFQEKYGVGYVPSYNQTPCPNCGKINWTESRPFNLMFRTTIGAVADEDDPTA